MFKRWRKKTLQTSLVQSTENDTNKVNEASNRLLEKEIFPLHTTTLNEGDSDLKATLLEYELNTYEQVPMIADRLIKGENLIINLADLEKKDWIKVLNFLAGVVYALNGRAQKISSQSYIFIVSDKDDSYI